MSEPRRLIEGDEGELVAQLVQSVAAERAPADARARAMLALSAATVAAAGGVAASHGATLGGKVGLGWLAIVKWLGVGAMAGVVTMGVGEVISTESAPQPVATSGIVSPVQRAKPQPASANRATAEVPAEVAAAPEAPLAPSAGFAPVPPPNGETPQLEQSAAVGSAAFEAPEQRAAADRLREEVGLIDSARQALTQGDASRALELLDSHQRRFPRGRLQPEAFVLRLEALAGSGHRAQAEQLARQFLTAQPKSPHRARILKIFSGALQIP